jgi:hypothetical protein
MLMSQANHKEIQNQTTYSPLITPLTFTQMIIKNYSRPQTTYTTETLSGYVSDDFNE